MKTITDLLAAPLHPDILDRLGEGRWVIEALWPAVVGKLRLSYRPGLVLVLLADQLGGAMLVEPATVRAMLAEAGEDSGVAPPSSILRCMQAAGDGLPVVFVGPEIAGAFILFDGGDVTDLSVYSVGGMRS